jgi:hypothetical protein
VAVIYRVSVRANPRILVIFAALPALPAAGVLLLVFVDRWIGLLGLAVGGYMAWHLGKFLTSHMRSRVETGEKELRCRTTANDEIVLPWSSITHAGQCFPVKGPDYLFVYSSGDDRLLTIPKEYSGYQGLAAEVRQRVAPGVFRELTLTAEETLKDRLKLILGE